MRKVLLMVLAASLLTSCLTMSEGEQRALDLETENNALRAEAELLRAENWTLRARLFEQPLRLGAISLRAIGGTGGTPFSRQCPADHVIAGLTGGSSHVVNSLIARCLPIPPADADPNDGPGHPTDLAPVGFIAEGIPYERSCPEGTVAVGAEGGSGFLVDSIHLLCGDPIAIAEAAQDAAQDGETGPESETSEASAVVVDAEASAPELAQAVESPEGTGQGTSEGTGSEATNVEPDAETDGLITRLARIGGGGGGYYRLECPPGYSFVGLSGRSGRAIDTLMWFCGPYEQR